MNRYKITYIVDEGETETAYITERTEAAARKVFKAAIKGREITDVELDDTDVPATKEQERETLSKIKQMVEELGPQSYIAAAFEGCFDVAELNIRDDAAYSLKARVEETEERLKEMGSVYNAAKMDATHLRTQLDNAFVQLKSAQEQIATLKRRQLSEQLRRDLWVMATNEAEASRAKMAKAAHKMAVCADNPNCVGFKESVAEYRKEEQRAESMEQMADELDAMEPKGE